MDDFAGGNRFYPSEKRRERFPSIQISARLDFAKVERRIVEETANFVANSIFSVRTDPV